MEPDDLLNRRGRSPTPPATARAGIASRVSSPSPREPAGLEAKPGPSVRLEKLRAFYGEAEPLKGIDLEFRANEVTAIAPEGAATSARAGAIGPGVITGLPGPPGDRSEPPSVAASWGRAATSIAMSGFSLIERARARRSGLARGC